MRQMTEVPVVTPQPTKTKSAPAKPQAAQKSSGKQVLVSEETEFVVSAGSDITVAQELNVGASTTTSRAAPPAAAFDSIINTRQGEPSVVAISAGKLNRLVTPFDEIIVDTLSKRLQVKQSGGVVMVATKSHEQIDIIIRDAENPANAVMLTLDPQPNIPARDVRINASFAGKSGRADDPENETAHPVAVRLKNVMRDMAKGEIPSGYSMKYGNKSAAQCALPGMQTKEAQVLTGSNTTIRVYAAKNISAETIEVDERGCSARNQLAAAVWPRLVLQSGESTELYVVEAPVREASKASTRPSVID